MYFSGFFQWGTKKFSEKVGDIFIYLALLSQDQSENKTYQLSTEHIVNIKEF